MTQDVQGEVILGLDPGFATTGFAILRCKPGDMIGTMQEVGVIRTSQTLSFVRRLMEIEMNLLDIIEKHRPTSAAVETLYFTINKKTALNVAHARGILLRALHVAKLPIGEYTPLQVKKAVTGNGKADKLEVQGMVSRLLGLDECISQDDAADALAIAICHAYHTDKRYAYV